MKQRLLKIALAVLIVFGFYWLINILYVYPAYETKNPLTPALVNLQLFTIPSGKDTVLVGKEGTIINVGKSSFIDDHGEPMKGKINVYLRECCSPEDIVLSGLTTTSNGNLLETGGMIYIMARQGKTQLRVNNSCKLGVVIPAGRYYKREMKRYSGVLNKSKGSVNWVKPAKLLNDMITVFKQNKEWDQDVLSLTEAVKKGIVDSTTIAVRSHNKFYTDVVNGNYNSYLPENKMVYIFETRKLGWINMDRLMKMTKTEKVNLTVRTESQYSSSRVFVKLILPGLGIYLHGCILDDGRFVFGENCDNKVYLPVGVKGYLLATSYHERTPYFSLVKLKITKSQSFNMRMKKTTEKQLVKIIKDKF